MDGEDFFGVLMVLIIIGFLLVLGGVVDDVYEDATVYGACIDRGFDGAGNLYEDVKGRKDAVCFREGGEVKTLHWVMQNCTLSGECLDGGR